MADAQKLYQTLKEFSSINEQFSITFKVLEAKKSLKVAGKINSLMSYIAKEILILPQCFDAVLGHFPNDFPRLLSGAISYSDDCPFSQPRHILNCILLSKAVKARADLKSFALKYFELYSSPFEEPSALKPKRSKIALPENSFVRDIDVVEACYFLLLSDPKFYRQKWKWSVFIKNYSVSNDCQVGWLSCHIIGIVLNLNESDLNALLAQRLTEDECLKLTIEFDRNSSFSRYPQDSHSLDQHPLISRKSKNIDGVEIISGIYIPALDGPKRKLLVEVPSTYNNLRKIAVGLSSGRALCLQGPVGCGKTGLVEHLAAATGRQLGDNFIKVQLGDQTDSKMLLGTYRCTDTPGEFIWQPGVLTQAVLQGSWLLLEDIDLCSMDIASVLASLLENQALTVPGYRDLVPVSPGFQLFLTQRLITTVTGHHHKRYSNAMQLLDKQLLQITIDPLSSAELKEILHLKYPQFDTVAERLVNVFHLFSNNDENVLPQKRQRLISTRDFFKWCSRASIDYDVKSQESALKILQDAIDVFCCSLPELEEALDLAQSISSHLGIIIHKADFFFKSYKPTVRLNTNSFVSGRASLERNHSIYSKQAKFCFTRPAAVLLERIMCCVMLNEPVLLVGETGTGKTSSIQYLARILGKKLIVINMNQQSDSADLLGGFKPVDLKIIISPIRREFESVFREFFDTEANKEFLKKVAFAFNKQKYTYLVSFMKKSTEAALKRLTNQLEDASDAAKMEKDQRFLARWQAINEKLGKVETQLKHSNALYFAFIEGSLVRAVQEGSWVLLDEINLANAETLECLSGLLEDSSGSLCLLERGDKKPVKRHPNFTLFACMNPATNVGKKDLPVGLRNRFTEFFVQELTEKSDLILLVNSYLDAVYLKEEAASRIVDFYLKVRLEMELSLSDGLGHKPHFSLRSLCRALMIASKNPCATFKRSLYEAFCLSFLTQLDSDSYIAVQNLIAKYIINTEKEQLSAITNQPIPEPKETNCSFLQFEDYWIKKGSLDPQTPDEYILTKSVRKNLKDLVRVVSIGKLPVLLQGETSVGKTSLITYLAKSSGNKCVRINNHEHTDLQEYIGSYVADEHGKLVFREGVLVEAMRKGHWIILDELNLAPTEVLEALNRVLDDNRELFIPETQETIKADPNFMLFATQNPPGAYGGRKMLSRAFRNRFVEFHFNEIPADELETILHQRCAMPPSYGKRMIKVMTELQVRRRGSAAFAGKNGFITLRDLFRWGERYRLAQNHPQLYDWNQHLVDEGYLVLAGKVRKGDERKEIAEVLQKHWQREVCLDNLFSLHEKTSSITKHILENLEKNSSKYPNIVWTFNMRKLAVLVAKALEFKEPVLLVGETGGGKTTICQLIAEYNGQELAAVNCHMHTESSDFIGGLRPVRDHSKTKSLFEWVDGPLLDAMLKGNVFLADEISLADDSVLERLNSLLEPERTLLLAEKAIDLNNLNNSETIVAHPDFVFIGTMNPGGDFGKKELSPALRNRFTEIWCDSCIDRDDLISIINRNLKINSECDFGAKMMDFIEWFRSTEIGKRFTISIRDILTWVNFVNQCSELSSAYEAYLHGARLVFLDSMGSGATSNENPSYLRAFKAACEERLNAQVAQNIPEILTGSDKITSTDSHFGIAPFFVALGQEPVAEETFSFEAPTTVLNTLNLLRGMQLNKAILLEGSPGVGKTSLVTAVAKSSRHKIFRVNLSDQTDISDLFGADLPVDGGTGGQFSWRDGPLLQALKEGSWILLDELNLASQSVLEGLNACLDHRGEIFIPELGKTFHVKTGTRFFACQNPMKQGGSRRGLPKSFLNRFIQVYVSPFAPQDMEVILASQFQNIPKETIKKMIEFNYRLVEDLDKHLFGNKGAPWECNLRDLTRWCQATLYHFDHNPSEAKELSPESTVQLIYVDRMRSVADKSKVEEVFEEIFGCSIKGSKPMSYVEEDNVYFGDIKLKRGQDSLKHEVLTQNQGHLILRGQLSALRSLSYCVNQNWMAILVGNSGVGKSSVVKTLANLAGKTLKTLPVTSAMDTTDILGGFEQTNYSRHLEEIAKEAERQTLATVQSLLIEEKVNKAAQLLEYWEEYLAISESTGATMEEEVQLFIRRVSKLEGLLKELYMKCSSTGEGNVILQLLDKCSKILDTVNGDKSLSAGGRFEWVNSILVKCLQEGSWLLVDNVNLCSAAVLDRLNALLEPNGVLTISERGVDEDGKMFEVKPHKDFRIFLTMDPKNGEISRAMRNRGVEIYMLNSSDTTSANQYDIQSLIDLEGLSNSKHIAVLLKVHEFISSLILSEQPGTTEILSCAALIAQQLHHGIDVFESFCTTCIEVYYKTRNPSEFNCNNVLEVISEGIKRCFQESDQDRDDFYNTNVTLNTRNFTRWSTLEKVKQQSAIYQSALRKFSQEKPLEVFKGSNKTQDVSIWSDIENIKMQNDFFISNHFYTLANLLTVAYSLSSLKDVEYRTLYLKTITNQPEWQGALELFYKTTKYFKWTDSKLPYDDRWVNDVGINSSSCNAINYALQIELHKLRDAFQIKYATKNSLHSYLHALKKREVSDAFSSPICTNYLTLRSEHFVFMRQLCTHFTKDCCFNSTVIKVLELLSWRQALHGFLTSVRAPSDGLKTPKAFQSKLEALALYYKWFYKYSVDKLAELLGAKVPEALDRILTSINKQLEEHFSTSYKIAANYKKLNNVPEFYTMDCQLAALELLQSYDLFNPSTNPKQTLALFKHSQEFRDSLIKLKSNIYSNSDLNCELSQVKTFPDKTITEQCLKIQELEVLPLLDALTEMLLLQIIKAIYAGNEIDLSALNHNILLKVDFNGVLLRYKTSGNKTLLHEIKKEFYSAAANSPSVRPHQFIDGADNAEIGLSIAGVEPVFLRTITQLLVNLENKCDTLRNFKDVEEQRDVLRLLLWDNMHALSSSKFDFISTQHSLLKNNLKDVINRFQDCLKLSKMSLENFSCDAFKDHVLKKTIEQIQHSYLQLKNGFTSRDDSLFSCMADIHLNLAFTELYLNSLLPRVDPLAKKAMKRNHIVSLISMFEQMKLSFDLQSSAFCNDECKHPYIKPLREMIADLQNRLQKYRDCTNIGVKACSYSHVVQQITHATSSIMKATILDDVNDCTKMVQNLQKQPYIEEVMNKIQHYIDTFESSVPSFNKIIHDWNQLRGFYPDIIEPLLSNICQFLYGFKLKLFWIKREILKFQYQVQFQVNLENELLKLAEFPSLNQNVSSLNDLVECYTIQREGPFMNYILCAEQPASVKEKEYVRLLKCEIQEAFNQCIVSSINFREIDKNLLGKFNELVETFTNLWNAQQENKEREKAEAESLYKTRTICDDKTEDEQIEEELKELLPNHHILDFPDLQQQSLSDDPIQVESPHNSFELMTDEDLMFVVDLHSKLFKNFIRAEWLIPEPSRHIQPDYVSPLMEKYKLVRRLMDNHANYFQYTLDAKLCASLAVLLAVSRKYDANELHVQQASPKMQNKKNKDFYKDSDIEEVKPSLHALNKLKIKIKELLEEWPDQPTLNTILTVIDRILNFDIKSPISRFLTGFDILLSKCHEWEQVAHSGISLIGSTPELTEQIIKWRKLELSRWKDLLNTTFTGLNKSLSKWWLYMYNLLKQYTTEEQVTKSQLIDTLQTFITKSPISEFHGRLELLMEFHCHAIGLPRSAKSDSFISILWNVYNYFNQFSTVITSKIKDLKSPIERKLKDYVKIVRWKEVTYWSIKNTVDKTHKMLHNFVREYKALLLQPVTPHLTNPASTNIKESVGIWDRPQRQNPKAYHYSLDADSYIVRASIKDSPYLSKARKIAKETILCTGYPDLLKSMDAFVNDVIETSSHLKNLEIDTTLPKEKQKSQAKNVLHQKHRALADLFQSLAKMGVSFKTGLIDTRLKNPAENFSIKPIDLSASFAWLGLNSMDEKILTIWDSCELYYYRSLMRYEMLDSALLTPAQDLGMQNIDRCRGFAAHLLTLCQQQKVNLIEATRSHYVLRGYAKQMREICEYSSFISLQQLEDIQKVLSSLAVLTSQLQLILNSCPEEPTFENQFIEIPQLASDSSKLKRKHDENWRKANQSLNGINSLMTKMLQVMHKNAIYQPNTSRNVVKPMLVPFANKSQLFKDLQQLNEYLINLKLIFNPIKVVDSLNWVSSSIASIIEKRGTEQAENPAAEHSAEQHLQNFTKTILIKIQNVYKKYREPRLQDSTEEELQLQANHLKVLLTAHLDEDFKIFDLNNILQAAEAVLTAVLGESASVSENIINQTAKNLPLFDQVLRLSEYFITQQVTAYRITCKLTSILMNIFIDLASKGFCIPPELSDEMDKEGASKPSDGMGLGEGQGERDVSDKIESEDQLDDAQPANQEKETNEDPDCKEEDNAIEMSEDFDSKLQDKKPTEDEDDQENQDSDGEEQMGETEKGADQLDQEIWGDDKDNDKDDNDDPDEKEEDGRGGEKDGEDNIQAKDDKESKQQPEDKPPSKDQPEDSEKNKKEINEMNEPEFDDEQTDPYHGNQAELPEPEPMDLPDDLQLDEGEEKDGEQPEENPFDIDEMKDQQVPEDQPDNEGPQGQEDPTNDEEKEFSSDDEEVTKNDVDDKIGDDESDSPNADENPPDQENIEEPSTSQDNEEPMEQTNEEDSALDQNPSNQENIEAMEVEDRGATDKTQATQAENLKSDQPIDDTCQEDKPDQEGLGQSQMEQSETGHSVQSNVQQEAKTSNSEQEEEKKRNERPGQSDLKRSLGDVNEPVEKRLKTVDAKDDSESNQEETQKQKADMYQHIQEAKKDHTKQVLDAATKEQAEEQKKEAIHEENEAEEEQMEVDGSNDVPDDEDEQLTETIADNLKETSANTENNRKKRKQQHPEGDAVDEITDVEIEGEIVKTSTVMRGAESFHHTLYHLIPDNGSDRLTQEEINDVRAQVEQELSTWKSAPTSIEAEQTWQKISAVTSSLAQDLSEQLRLVLEPTQASHLKGDFRTGRRINMRKVIPYIASQFRKDKIWLRRTKPSKREYQIVLAIDDSASMADNHSKELAFESVALISKALSLLESGQLAVVSFGENTEIHHKLTEPFTDKCGVQLLQNFQFNQQKTYIGKLLNFVTEMFDQSNMRSSIPNARLLLIVSDGQGVFSEGKTFVNEAVRRAKLANIFTVFVIIDNPESRHSVLDIRSTVFKDGKFVAFQNYMDEFPFSFYLILRDINSLPGVLSDALMQWFEMVTSQQ